MKVLSLFDGISCGMVALERAGIPVDTYYASEIEKDAIKIALKNYPEIKELGDVTGITEEQIKSMSSVDLVIGGSPCQGLSSSNAWLKKGEYGVNGTGKSKLFWEYVRVLRLVQKYNPNVKFLLENVGSANKKDKAIIDEVLGVTGVPFNSQLLSAQNRNRVYWTDIPFTVPTQRKQVYMQDILEKTVDDKYYLAQKTYAYIMTPASKGWQSGKIEINLQIARPLTATMHKMHRADTDNYVSTTYKPQGKTNVRRLTPLECERLQTLPDNYTAGISDTKRYQCIGNGWTVDVIAHILKGLKQ
ncbi:DNA (cytosine-5-)-methyltransferase [bacterium]|nr:DNA (cytosine-5-)-methyltransferase [bacterium]